MSFILAHGSKVALKRFMDNVPMICFGILQTYAEKMKEELSNVLDSQIEVLVAAPPNVVSRMNDLKAQMATLEKGIRTIKDLSLFHVI